MSTAPTELRRPDDRQAKREYVREMFTAIAPRYDLLNHLLSLNRDRWWRQRAVDQLGWQAVPRGTYLDLCAGTLDLAAELAARPGFGGTVVGADFALRMLELGRGKAAGIRPVGADALTLPFPAGRFDGCTVGFGIRNLADVGAGLAEIARVLKPGTRLVVLEFSTPTAWPLRPLYLWYFRRVLPGIGRLISKHRTAYTYLPDSVSEFGGGRELLALMETQGFHNVDSARLTLGIVSLYWGTVR